MRNLMWFTLGFGAACGLCAYTHMPSGWMFPALALAVLLMIFSRYHSNFRRLSLTILGFTAGLFWFAQFSGRYLNPVYELDGQTIDAVIVSSDYGEKTDYGVRTDGRIQIGERSYQVSVYLDSDHSIEPGMSLSGPFRFRVTAPGARSESTYFQGEGIFLLAYQEDEITVRQEEASWRDIPAQLRHRIVNILEDALSVDTYPFAKALLLGNSSDLDYVTVTGFSVSGIRHIVAVSGLHVSILFTLLSVVSFRKRFLSSLIGFPTLFVFAAIAGFTPSVSRACIMSGLMLIALLVNREYDGPTALPFAGLILLLINPLVITSVSYQLSFASVSGIFLFAPGIRKWLTSFLKTEKRNRIQARFLRGCILTASVTLSATVATTPICAYYFGTVSLVGVITNLLVLWVISLIFFGLILLCLLHGVWTAGAVLLGNVISIFIRYVLFTAKTIADFPLAAVYTRSPYITVWLVFVYVLLLVFLVSKNRKPMILSCCAVLGLCAAFLASWAEPMLDDVRFTVLDVGQGQCLLLQTEGKTYMVDCGGDSDASAADIAAETLLSQGVSKLDGLILTHFDRDHAGAVENLLSRIDVGLLVLPPVYSALELPADQVIYAKNNLQLTSGDTNLQIFTSAIPGSGNENSLCILFDTPKCDILITGDRDSFGERMLLRYASIPDVDVLVAGHHGSKNSTCEELLTAVGPEIVCISAGAGNSYGHPAPELLERLQKFGCSVYRTDLHGNILIRR